MADSGSPIETGDNVKITMPTLGKNMRAEVNGEEFPGLTCMTITTRVSEVTRLTIEALYPWPAVVGPDGGVPRRTFEGYFIRRDDWEAFDAWRTSLNDAA